MWNNWDPAGYLFYPFRPFQARKIGKKVQHMTILISRTKCRPNWLKSRFLIGQFMTNQISNFDWLKLLFAKLPPINESFRPTGFNQRINNWSIIFNLAKNEIWIKIEFLKKCTKILVNNWNWGRKSKFWKQILKTIFYNWEVLYLRPAKIIRFFSKSFENHNLGQNSKFLSKIKFSLK